MSLISWKKVENEAGYPCYIEYVQLSPRQVLLCTNGIKFTKTFVLVRRQESKNMIILSSERLWNRSKSMMGLNTVLIALPSSYMLFKNT